MRGGSASTSGAMALRLSSKPDIYQSLDDIRPIAPQDHARYRRLYDLLRDDRCVAVAKARSYAPRPLCWLCLSSLRCGWPTPGSGSLGLPCPVMCESSSGR